MIKNHNWPVKSGNSPICDIFVVGFIIIIIVDWTVWLWLKASTNLDPEVIWSDSGSAYNDGDRRNVSYLVASGTTAYRRDSVDDWNSRPPHLVRAINQILKLKITISFEKSDIKIIACKFHLELCQLAICFCSYLLIYPRMQGWYNTTNKEFCQMSHVRPVEAPTTLRIRRAVARRLHIL